MQASWPALGREQGASERGTTPARKAQGTNVHFQVNEQPYFLNFIREEGRWLLFKPTRSGIEAVPVVDDGGPLLFPEEIEVETDPEVVN